MANTPDQRQEFSWSAHPARERSARAALGTVAVAGLAWLSGALMQSIWWAVIAALVVVVALNRFYFRSRFTIDDEGITASYPLSRRRCRWSELRRFACGADGALLSPRARPSWLDGARGIHVLFGAHRADAVARIRAHLPAEAGGGSEATWAP